MRARAFALMCVLTSALSGCGFVTIRTADGQEPRGHRGDGKPLSGGAYWADVDERTYPETMALLKRADEALGAQRFDDALTASRQAGDKLHEEYDQKPLKDVVVSEANTRVRLEQKLFEGLALHGAGRDFDALLAMAGETFDFSGCRLDLRPRCQAHAEWLTSTYPGIVHGPSFLQLVAATDVALGDDLNTISMDVNEREIKAKKGFAGLFIEPTSMKNDKDGVTLRIDGKTSHDSYEECNKVGEVRIGGTDFNVDKCHQHGYTAPRANFFVTVSTDDAKKITGAKGERVFLIFEVKNWKKNGNNYTTGPARVGYVSAPPSH